VSQPGQEGLSWLLTATTQAGALRPTEVSAKAGTGDQDANVFTALECYLAELVARPPGCTESESPPSKRQHDSVATSDEELAARRARMDGRTRRLATMARAGRVASLADLRRADDQRLPRRRARRNAGPTFPVITPRLHSSRSMNHPRVDGARCRPAANSCATAIPSCCG